MRCTLALALLVSSSFASASTDFSFSAPKGAFDVGVRVVQQFDYARQYKGDVDLMTGKPASGEKARPIQTLIWYPGEPHGNNVTYGDYLRMSVSEEEFDLTSQAIHDRYSTLLASRAASVGTERANNLINKSMLAVRDAKPKSGRFPLIIYASSFSASAIENSDLCEYLASKGYVVMASRSMGAHSLSMTEDIDGIEAQAADIEFLIGYAHTLANVDLSRIAVAGFSWGGIANVFAAAKDNRIRALVALDGSVRTYPQLVDGGTEAVRYVTPERVTVPLLYVASEPHSIEWMVQTHTNTNYSFLSEMKYSDVYLLTMHSMVHPNFSSMYLRFAADGDFSDYSRDEVSNSHSWVARYTGEFLDAYLKNDSHARDFLVNTPAVNGVPPHLMSAESFKASMKPVNRETFSATLASQGFDHATEVYSKFKSQNPRFQLGVDELNYWGYKLMRDGYSQDAIGIFTLATVLYPADANTFDSLADGYEHVHDTSQAIKNYQHSLELNKKNRNAAERLKQLGAGN